MEEYIDKKRNKSAEGNPDIDVTNRQFNVRLETLTEKDLDVDFNVISSVYGKLQKNIAGWITNRRLLYANKEKALDYISVSAPIAEAQYKQELDSSTKIVQNFENVITFILEYENGDCHNFPIIFRMLSVLMGNPLL